MLPPALLALRRHALQPPERLQRRALLRQQVRQRPERRRQLGQRPRPVRHARLALQQALQQALRQRREHALSKHFAPLAQHRLPEQLQQLARIPLLVHVQAVHAQPGHAPPERHPPPVRHALLVLPRRLGRRRLAPRRLRQRLVPVQALVRRLPLHLLPVQSSLQPGQRLPHRRARRHRCHRR
jgi:hypothetical protein